MLYEHDENFCSSHSMGHWKSSSDFLMHYGVVGMRWGVRRWQNKDGTLTAAGKIRQSEANRLAHDIHLDAKKREPEITNDVIRAVRDSGAEMYGLDHRLKTEESIARKIKTNSKEKRISEAAAADNIRDAIRYTSLSDEDNYVDRYFTVKNALASKGYKEVRCRNYFDLYKQGKAKHKQITSVFADNKGNQFELQFQTPASIKAKEAKTPLYEEARKIGVEQKRKDDLIKQMESLAEKVNDPKNVRSIKTHG